MTQPLPMPSDHELRPIRDGGTLWRTPAGLLIVRRKKHEWSEQVAALQGAQLRRETDRIRGSKFSREWTLEAYVRWLDQQLSRLGWDAQTAAGEHTVETGREIGVSLGQPVTRVKIVISSRCVHAYPVLE